MQVYALKLSNIVLALSRVEWTYPVEFKSIISQMLPSLNVIVISKDPYYHEFLQHMWPWPDAGASVYTLIYL